MRLTIERMRTLVLVAASLLLVATLAFLAIGKWRSPFSRRDLPSRLGFDIQQESNGVTFSHALGGHSQFKIHASKVVQLKQGSALLSDVKIELYGEDGSRVDRIEGATFEFNQKNGTATASGPVQITLMRPGQAPAIAPKAAPKAATGGKDTPLNTATRAAAAGQVLVKTSGLAFSVNTGVATTANHVDFSSAQGAGSSLGATYDSKQGHLILDRQVELRTERAGNPAQLHAAHAEFDRTGMICQLRSATTDYRGGQATAAEARVEFRTDGSAVRLDATGGFQMTTAEGGHVQSPRAMLEFDEHNQPRHGRLEGGVVLDSTTPGRNTHGTAPAADLDFTHQGDLRHAHLEGGVDLASEEEGRTSGAHPEPFHGRRTWRSQTVEIDFRKGSHGQTEPATLAGSGPGGVLLTSQTERGKAAPTLARLAAEQVNGLFGSGSALSQIVGTGHASMTQTLATGARQTATGDRLEAHFAPSASASASTGQQMQSATLDGHVTLVQLPETKRGGGDPLHAFAGHAIYASEGQWLHLTTHPRIDQGGLQLTAERIDITQDTGDAFAHGNVKATWTQTAKSGQTTRGLSPSSQEPAHVIAAEAQLHQTPGQTDSIATFHGHARLWQQANSVAAPTIILTKSSQSLEARSTDHAEPVRLVMLSQTSHQEGKPASTPSVVRVHGGQLYYTGLDRTALIESGVLGQVIAETGAARSQSDRVELKLLAPAGKTSPGPAGQVERMIARGHVTLTSEGRRGTGEQLVFTGSTGQYVLTGTPSAPPRMVDPAHGTVSGAALIFRSRDDSVSIEGGGRPTSTQTTAPR
jgi:lipopolysaccharide export system protein LptA